MLFSKWLMDLTHLKPTVSCHIKTSPLIYIRDHSFSTSAKFSEKTNISYPRYAHVHVRISGGKKCYFFGKLYKLTKWMMLVSIIGSRHYYQEKHCFWRLQT